MPKEVHSFSVLILLRSSSLGGSPQVFLRLSLVVEQALNIVSTSECSFAFNALFRFATGLSVCERLLCISFSRIGNCHDRNPEAVSRIVETRVTEEEKSLVHFLCAGPFLVMHVSIHLNLLESDSRIGQCQET